MYWRFFEYYCLVFVLINLAQSAQYIQFIKLPREFVLCTYQVRFWSTILIRLQAERFLHKSTLNLGKFEAAEEVSAYSRVFFMKEIFLANENSNKCTCILLQVELYREASNTYTFRLRLRTPRIEKMHSFPITASAQGTLPILYFEGLPTLQEPRDELLLFSHCHFVFSRKFHGRR